MGEEKQRPEEEAETGEEGELYMRVGEDGRPRVMMRKGRAEPEIVIEGRQGEERTEEEGELYMTEGEDGRPIIKMRGKPSMQSKEEKVEQMKSRQCRKQKFREIQKQNC